MSGPRLAPLRAPPLEDFFALLRARGFRVGTPELVRVLRLLDQVETPIATTRLASVIAPVLTQDQEEQEQFHVLFSEFFPGLVEPEQPRSRPPTVDVDLSQLATPKHAPVVGLRSPWVIVAGVIALVLLFNTIPGSLMQGLLPGTPPSEGLSRLQAGLLAGIAGFVVLAAVWSRLNTRKRIRRASAYGEKGPPYDWNSFRGDADYDPVDAGQVRRTARGLLEHEPSDARELAIEDSVAATIEALGMASPRFRERTRSPQYLALVHRQGERDHLTALTDRLLDALESEEVQITRYYYGSDPDVCLSTRRRSSASLLELTVRYGLSKLLVFGDGEAWLDPVTGALHEKARQCAAWPHRAFLTPIPQTRWGARERALSEAFVLAQATPDGLEHVVRAFSLPPGPTGRQGVRLRGDPSAAYLGGYDLEALREGFGPKAFRCLCACAVYPELHWQLTRQIVAIEGVSTSTLDHEALLELVRLPWFRQGRMPDDLRLELIERLDPAMEAAVRRELVRLIRASLAPADSVAREQQEVQLLVQASLQTEDAAWERRRAFRSLAVLPRELSQQDAVAMTLLDSGRIPGRGLRLPGGRWLAPSDAWRKSRDALRSVLDRRGVDPGRVLTAAVSGFLVITAIVAAVLALQPLPSIVAALGLDASFDIALLTLGLGVVYFGSEWFLRGVLRIARSLRLEASVAALTFVAIGLTVPELVHLAGAASGDVGHVNWAVIFNLGLVLGVGALLRPQPVAARLVWREMPLFLLLISGLFVLALDYELSRADGVILLMAFLAYLIFVFHEVDDDASGSGLPSVSPADEPRVVNAPDVFWTLVGVAGLTLGAYCVSEGSTQVLAAVGVAAASGYATAIGAFFGALPELVLVIVAMVRWDTSIVVPMVLGSSLVNVSLAVGLASIWEPLPVQQSTLSREFPAALLMAVILLPILRSGWIVRRWEGALLLAATALVGLYLL